MLSQNEITERMIELAELIGYEYKDIDWLAKAMYCKVTGHKKGGGRNRQFSVQWGFYGNCRNAQ